MHNLVITHREKAMSKEETRLCRVSFCIFWECYKRGDENEKISLG